MSSQGTIVLRSSNIQNGKIDLTDIVRVSKEIPSKLVVNANDIIICARTEIKKEDFIYPCYGGNGIRGYTKQYNKEGIFSLIGRQGALCGNINIGKGKFFATEHAVVVNTFSETNVNWCFYFLKQLNLNQYATSTAQPGLSVNNINQIYIPLPPLKEQDRIANEIDRLFTLIEQLEEDKAALQQLVSQLKSKILSLAIRGQLVPQDANDEPAEVLLKQINPEYKSRGNLHYKNLPKGWAVCKLEDILEYKQPQEYIVNSVDYDDSYNTPVLTAGKSFIIGYTNETEGIFNELPVIIFDDFTTASKYVDFKFKVKSSAMKILKPKGNVNLAYIHYFMSITRLISDTHKRYWISEYSKLIVPLPPLAEQQRIVEQVEKLFKQLDEIQNALAI